MSMVVEYQIKNMAYVAKIGVGGRATIKNWECGTSLRWNTTISGRFVGRHDTHHNDTQHNDKRAYLRDSPWTTFSIMDLSTVCCYADCLHAQCRILFIPMLIVVMLSVIIMSVVMLSVVMLCVVLLSVVAPVYWTSKLHLCWTYSDQICSNNCYDFSHTNSCG